MTKLNYREIIRRALKYVIIIATVSLSCITVTNKLDKIEILWISIITGLIYCLLDIMMPSIKLIINKINNTN